MCCQQSASVVTCVSILIGLWRVINYLLTCLLLIFIVCYVDDTLWYDAKIKQETRQLLIAGDILVYSGILD